MSDEENVVSLSTSRKKERAKEKLKTPLEKIKEQEIIYCSFCGRPNHIVVKMIKGPDVNICSECVMICVQYFILEDTLASSEVQKVLDSFWRGIKK